MVSSLTDNNLQQAMFAGERIAFTGTLASMTHRQAAALAESHGGVWSQHVSKQCTMLVIGEEGWPLEADGTPSVKLQQANRLRDEGLPVRIVSESEWLRILGLDDRLEEVRRHYTPVMLSQMLSVPVSEIRRWERSGLIRPAKHVMRLPYFDYREAAGARRLTELLHSGVSRRLIKESLEHLQTWVGGTDRPLAQLELLEDTGELVYRDPNGPVEPLSGQRLFDFDLDSSDENQPSVLVMPQQTPVELTAEEWLETANRHLEADELLDAVEAFRCCLMDWHQRAEIHFQLAETLYRMDNLPGALERYHIAVELEPNYLEAWTQLGCVHAMQGHLEHAIQAFRIALNLHPEYPDAHWHLAQAFESQGQPHQARIHWQTYLKYDQRGPWAEIARDHLEAHADS